MFGRLRGDLIQELVRKDREKPGARAKEQAQPALYRVWPDFEVRPLTDRSIATVKADAARNAFGAFGRDIVWAVVDSGIDGSHPHFRTHRNLELTAPLKHCDFTTFGERMRGSERRRADRREGARHPRRRDHRRRAERGSRPDGVPVEIKATVNKKDEHGRVIQEERRIEAISGMAPACKLSASRSWTRTAKGR